MASATNMGATVIRVPQEQPFTRYVPEVEHAKAQAYLALRSLIAKAATPLVEMKWRDGFSSLM